MEINEVYPCMVLSAPEWFERDDFEKYMNGRTEAFDYKNPHRPLHFNAASWGYSNQGWEAGEFADVFLTYDHDEGSNSDLPEDIWKAICTAAKENGFEFCVVWIKPV